MNPAARCPPFPVELSPANAPRGSHRRPYSATRGRSRLPKHFRAARSFTVGRVAGSVYAIGSGWLRPGGLSTARLPLTSGWLHWGQMAAGGGRATEAPWVLPAGHVGVCGWMADGNHYPLDTWGSTEARIRPLGRDGRLASST